MTRRSSKGKRGPATFVYSSYSGYVYPGADITFFSLLLSFESFQIGIGIGCVARSFAVSGFRVSVFGFILLADMGRRRTRKQRRSTSGGDGGVVVAVEEVSAKNGNGIELGMVLVDGL